MESPRRSLVKATERGHTALKASSKGPQQVNGDMHGSHRHTLVAKNPHWRQPNIEKQ